jgi:hypothetical protein
MSAEGYVLFNEFVDGRPQTVFFKGCVPSEERACRCSGCNKVGSTADGFRPVVVGLDSFGDKIHALACSAECVPAARTKGIAQLEGES